MKRYFVYLIIFSFLILNSCKEDSPSEPEVTNNTGTTIGVQGGSIKVDDGQVTIASGTFAGDQKLILTKTTVPAGYESSAISSAYKLENVPNSFSKPIELGVKLTSNVSGDTILAVKVPSYVVSGDKAEDRIIYLPGKITNGVLTAKIENLTAASFAKVATTNEDGKFVIEFWSKANEMSFITSKKHFKINFTVGTDTAAIRSVGQILEKCYDFVDTLKFRLSKRTGWPMNVNIVNQPGVFGVYVSSKRTMNYDYMEINKGSLTNPNELKATLIHEFFHAAQTMYNPHWNLTSAYLGRFKTGYEHLWVDEALSTYSSYSYLKDPSFEDKNLTDYFDLIVEGYLTSKTTADKYGYGMSVFIKYLTDKYGEKTLIKVYEKIAAGSNSLDAISSICSLNLDQEWSDFIEAALTDKIKIKGFLGKYVILNKATRVSFPDLKTDEQTLNLKMGSISSKIYMFNLPSTIDASKNAQLTLSTNDGELYIYKASSSSDNLRRIGISTSEITITGLKSLIDNKEKLIVFLIKGRTNFPYDGTKDVTFKYKFEEAADLSKVLSASISVRFAANENNGSLVTPWESYVLPKFTPTDNWRGAWVGNKFVADFSRTKFASIYSNVTGTFSFVFDFAKKEITELTYDVSYNADGRSARTKIVLQNLALSNYNTQFGPAYAFYEFIKLGDVVCSNIKEIIHTETNTVSGAVTTVTKTGCNSKSQIWIKLNEF